ncbi:MAG: STAS domain-containing protein [Tepidisphaeraceae bacterium]
MSDEKATEIEVTPQAVVVHIKVKMLDEANTKRVHEEVAAAVAQNPGLPFVLDMAQVKFLPSITLGALVKLASEFRQRNQKIGLASLQPTVRDVMTITRLDRLLDVYDDVEAAKKGACAQ